jgi:cytochrome b561
VGAAALLALSARRRSGRPLVRGVLLATASGILFGLVAGLLKLSTLGASQGVLHLLSRWPTWALIAVGVGAILLNQRAYQATRLSVSTPVLNICQLVVSLTFGLAVFRERLFTSPLVVVAEVLGLAVMVLGVTRLASRAAASPGIEPEEAAGDDTELGARYDDADRR